MFKFLIRKRKGAFHLFIGLRWSTRKRFTAGGLSRSDYQPLSSTAYALLFRERHPTAAQAYAELLRIKNFMCEQGHSFCAKAENLPPGMIRATPSPISQAENFRKKLLRTSLF